MGAAKTRQATTNDDNPVVHPRRRPVAADSTGTESQAGKGCSGDAEELPSTEGWPLCADQGRGTPAR